MVAAVPRFLHVANGTSTTALIEAAAIPGARSIWGDVLYEGPVPGGIGDAELLDTRARFLADAAEHPYPAVADDLRAWRAVIDAHETYDELVLWYEHDLFDQLNLLQLLSRLPRRVPADKRVSLICVGTFPGRPSFKGLGELTPPELASLFDTRAPLGDSQYALAALGWQAFRDSTPEAVERLLQTDTTAMPFLARALRRFLEEYPWTADGLSRTERRLLQLSDVGPTPLIAIFPRMHDGEDAYYVTDGTLLGLAVELSDGAMPLLEMMPGRGDGPAGLDARVTLTSTGRDVLGGRVDRVTARGIDRWFGGVHVRPGNVWRWDQASERVIRA